MTTITQPQTRETPLDLDQKIEAANQNYLAKETALKQTAEQERQKKEGELRTLIDSYLPKLALGDISQVETFTKELTKKTAAMSPAAETFTAAAQNAKNAEIEAAFNEQFKTSARDIQTREAFLQRTVPAPEELARLDLLLTRRQPDYQQAKQRLAQGQTDAIDAFIISEYERAHKEVDSATEKPSHLTVPVRLSTIASKGRLEITLPKTEGTPGKIVQTLDALCKTACEENALQYAPIETEHATGYSLQAPTETVAAQLEETARSNETLAQAGITLKLYRTERAEGAERTERVDRAQGAERAEGAQSAEHTVQKTYTTPELQKLFNLDRLELARHLYTTLGQDVINSHSVLERKGNAKRRIFNPSILPLLETITKKQNAAAVDSVSAQAETDDENQTTAIETPSPAPVLEPKSESEQADTQTADPAKYYTRAEATRILQYVSTGAIYNNKNLVLETIDGGCYVTRESLDSFLQTNERHGTKWKPRKTSVAEEDLDGELERPIGISKSQTAILKLHKQGLDTDEIAAKLGRTSKASARSIQRNLEMMGVYSATYVQSTFPTLDVIKTRTMPGVKTYPKDEVRLDLLENLVNNWKGKTLRYVGLEGPHFCSYIEIARLAEGQLDPKGSLIAERDEHSYHIMQSFTEHSESIEGGEIFKGLRVKYGELNKVLSEQRAGAKFNLLNFDYEGPVSGQKLGAVSTLFTRQLLDDDVFLCATLNDHPRLRSRLKDKPHSNGKGYEQGFSTDDQHEIFGKLLKEKAHASGYELKEIAAKNYASRGSPMLTLTYKLWRAQ